MIVSGKEVREIMRAPIVTVLIVFICICCGKEQVNPIAEEPKSSSDIPTRFQDREKIIRAVDFYRAADDGDVKTVNRFLDEGMNPNEDLIAGTALTVAALAGHLDVMKLLVSRGADVNKQCRESGTTALIKASFGGHVDAVMYLLEEGGAVNPRDKQGMTALMYAGLEGEVIVIELLLNSGANLNETSKEGETTLAFAAKNGHAPTVILLLEKGADPNVITAAGKTPLILAAEEGSRDTVVALVDRTAGIEARDNKGLTALLHAAAEGHNEVARVLLDHGAGVNTPDPKGRTPLILASYNGHEEMIRILIENGADVNLKDEFGRSALTQARRLGHSQAAAMLVRAGAHDTSEHMAANPMVEIDPEEYAVYSAVIDEVYLEYRGTPGVSEHAKIVVISELTVPYIEPYDDGCADVELDGVDEELLADYNLKNAENHKLQNLFRHELKCVLMSQEELTKIFEHGGWWGEFYEKYPDSHGLLDLSRVGFNKQKDKALVYAGNQREGLSGVGFCILLSKKDGVWVVQKSELVWIS